MNHKDNKKCIFAVTNLRMIMEKSGLRKVIQYVVMLALAALLLYYSLKVWSGGVLWRVCKSAGGVG